MTDFQHILCPVDFDANSLAAVALARDVAVKYGGKLCLFHVARIPAADMDAPVAIEPHPHWETSAQARLREAAAQILGQSVAYETVVKGGIPESSIIEAVSELNIDLIVMASHGRTGLAHLVLGSVAEEVVRLAPCPVMVVKPHK
jgi:nucleotide-binding universal stress UspA family protein